MKSMERVENCEAIFKKILDCSFMVHTVLGPGLLEKVYEECLSYELTRSGLTIARQKPYPLKYKEITLDVGYRLDLMVQDMVIVEIKSVECFSEIHTAQILTYLKLTGCKLGLLLNFNTRHLKDGIRRFIR